MKANLVTIDEANAMIPLLCSIVMDIRSSWNAIITKRAELEKLEKGPVVAKEEEEKEKPGRSEELKAELNILIERINTYIREVEDLGCFVEEFKRGIINFPSLYHGRKVFLCWGLGDDVVTCWHELDESYNDRVKIGNPGQFLNHNPNSPKKIRG